MTSMSARRIALSAGLAASLLMLVSGCASAPANVPSVATFEIEGQMFKIELITRSWSNTPNVFSPVTRCRTSPSDASSAATRP